MVDGAFPRSVRSILVKKIRKKFKCLDKQGVAQVEIVEGNRQRSPRAGRPIQAEARKDSRPQRNLDASAQAFLNRIASLSANLEAHDGTGYPGA